LSLAFEFLAAVVKASGPSPDERNRFRVEPPEVVDGHLGSAANVTILAGTTVRLRPAARSDMPVLVRIRQSPEVYAWWRGGADLEAAVEADFAEAGSNPYVIERDGQVVGWIQWSAEDEPDYRHATMDIYVDPAVHGRGIGADAVRTLARHLIADHGYLRVEIDPAADNKAAIRCYTKVGFRPVGILRRRERGLDGSWHDTLLMDLLAEELEG
jgi:aminoglycoside 6'-N-acetyltransferase